MPGARHGAGGARGACRQHGNGAEHHVGRVCGAGRQGQRDRCRRGGSVDGLCLRADPGNRGDDGGCRSAQGGTGRRDGLRFLAAGRGGRRQGRGHPRVGDGGGSGNGHCAGGHGGTGCRGKLVRHQDARGAPGGAFHQRRLQIVSSQVGQVPADRRVRWSYRRRLEKALDLLADPALDVLVSGESPFDQIAQDYGAILEDPSTLCHRVRYAPAL